MGNREFPRVLAGRALLKISLLVRKCLSSPAWHATRSNAICENAERTVNINVYPTTLHRHQACGMFCALPPPVVPPPGG